jgi:membrane carboxypeptidase/penicillin-binding protein
MRLTLKGVPENQMAMPDGIVSVRIDPQTGCRARSGQRGTIFEFFREGHVPECVDVGELPDIFNAAGSVDPDPEEEEDEESEPLF